MTNEIGGSWLILSGVFRILFGPFDLSLIAIGAYCPRHFMQPQHVDPVEAGQVHTELKSKLSLGIHWGTFILANEPEDEPPQLLQAELDNRKLSRSEFITTSIGQTIATPRDYP